MEIYNLISGLASRGGSNEFFNRSANGNENWWCKNWFGKGTAGASIIASVRLSGVEERLFHSSSMQGKFIKAIFLRLEAKLINNAVEIIQKRVSVSIAAPPFINGPAETRGDHL